jgi:hypothetical protein
LPANRNSINKAGFFGAGRVFAPPLTAMSERDAKLEGVLAQCAL